MATQAIDEESIQMAIDQLQEALRSGDEASRHEQFASAVRTMTRIWAVANPDFDGDAWYPVSYLLTEHWTQIQWHMDGTS